MNALKLHRSTTFVLEFVVALGMGLGTLRTWINKRVANFDPDCLTDLLYGGNENEGFQEQRKQRLDHFFKSIEELHVSAIAPQGNDEFLITLSDDKNKDIVILRIMLQEMWEDGGPICKTIQSVACRKHPSKEFEGQNILGPVFGYGIA